MVSTPFGSGLVEATLISNREGKKDWKQIIAQNSPQHPHSWQRCRARYLEHEQPIRGGGGGRRPRQRVRRRRRRPVPPLRRLRDPRGRPARRRRGPAEPGRGPRPKPGVVHQPEIPSSGKTSGRCNFPTALITPSLCRPPGWTWTFNHRVLSTLWRELLKVWECQRWNLLQNCRKCVLCQSTEKMGRERRVRGGKRLKTVI